MVKVSLALAALCLGGCGATMPPGPPPVLPCQEREPARPVMPTEYLVLGASVDSFVQAAQAEIDRREGYEILLRTALQNCIRR